MTSGVTWTGMEELKEALSRLPQELAGESTGIVEGAANGAAVAVKQVYGQHRVSGRLQDGVYVSQFLKGKFFHGFLVKSSSPIAWLFDHGSQTRQYVTESGAIHKTGAMWEKRPPTHIFVKTMIRFRRGMYEELKGVLVRAGLLVSGDA